MVRKSTPHPISSLSPSLSTNLYINYIYLYHSLTYIHIFHYKLPLTETTKMICSNRKTQMFFTKTDSSNASEDLSFTRNETFLITFLRQTQLQHLTGKKTLHPTHRQKKITATKKINLATRNIFHLENSTAKDYTHLLNFTHINISLEKCKIPRHTYTCMGTHTCYKEKYSPFSK